MFGETYDLRVSRVAADRQAVQNLVESAALRNAPTVKKQQVPPKATVLTEPERQAAAAAGELAEGEIGKTLYSSARRMCTFCAHCTHGCEYPTVCSEYVEYILDGGQRRQ